MYIKKQIKLKKSQKFNLVSTNFQKSLSKTPLFKELLNQGAFNGDYYKYVHFSQQALVYAYKNKTSFYNIEACISLLNKAIKFLRTVKIKKNQEFVFVGNPPAVDLESKYTFKPIKVTFFGSGIWQPGFFSKNPTNCQRVIVVYDINTNYIAFCEAVSIKVPVVAFASPYCDIRGVDYPVVLNLKNAGLAYAIFCKTLMKK